MKSVSPSEGLKYQKFMFHDSVVHMLEVDLQIRDVRAVPVGPDFPFWKYYGNGSRPVSLAKDAGALACVGGGFEVTKYHHDLLVGGAMTGDPLHTLVIDREIWSNGASPGGGFGFLVGDKQAWVRKNRMNITIWYRAEGGVVSQEVETVNDGHHAKIGAFTTRGSTNQFPIEGKHYVLLGEPGEWIDGSRSSKRSMKVLANQKSVSIQPTDNTIVLESRWRLPMTIGDTITWTQNFGVPGVRQIISGATGIVFDGVNIVPSLEMDPQAPNGPDNWYVRENPRTALGVSNEGRTAVLVSVEGRIPTSPGLRLKELATMMIGHGVHDAVNVDGGGSTMMWVRGIGENGLVCDSCYGSGTYDDTRPDMYATAVF